MVIVLVIQSLLHSIDWSEFSSHALSTFIRSICDHFCASLCAFHLSWGASANELMCYGCTMISQIHSSMSLHEAPKTLWSVFRHLNTQLDCCVSMVKILLPIGWCYWSDRKMNVQFQGLFFGLSTSNNNASIQMMCFLDYQFYKVCCHLWSTLWSPWLWTRILKEWIMECEVRHNLRTIE